jgi:hypothetical protein
MYRDILIECIVCKKEFEFDDLEQIILGASNRKEKFFAYCCKECKKTKSDGSEIITIEPYGSLFLVEYIKVTQYGLGEMIMNNIIRSYHRNNFR